MAEGFKYESYVKEVLNQIEENNALALEEMGRVIKNDARRRVRKDTGEGEQSIGYRVDPEKSRVVIGSTLWRLIFLEMGTRKMRAYRFLRPAAMTNIRVLKKAAEGQLKFRSKVRRKWKK